LGTILFVTGSCRPACLTSAMNSVVRPARRVLKTLTRSPTATPSLGIAALTSSSPGKVRAVAAEGRAGLWARLPVGEPRRDPLLGVRSALGEPGGLFLGRVSLERPAREVSVSLPEP